MNWAIVGIIGMWCLCAIMVFVTLIIIGWMTTIIVDIIQQIILDIENFR